MLEDEKLKALHATKGFKYYTFGGLLPVEREKTYSKGDTYHFTIRSLDEVFINKVSIAMRKNIDNPHLLIVETDKKTIKQFFITELYSATPVIVTMAKGRYWVKEDDLMTLHKQLQDNLEKKYQDFYNKPIKSNQSFIQLFELKNHRLQTIQSNKRYSDGKPVKF
jgi:CRISPR-associated endoribonuclease Cas6